MESSDSSSSDDESDDVGLQHHGKVELFLETIEGYNDRFSKNLSNRTCNSSKSDEIPRPRDVGRTIVGCSKEVYLFL